MLGSRRSTGIASSRDGRCSRMSSTASQPQAKHDRARHQQSSEKHPRGQSMGTVRLLQTRNQVLIADLARRTLRFARVATLVDSSVLGPVSWNSTGGSVAATSLRFRAGYELPTEQACRRRYRGTRPPY